VDFDFPARPPQKTSALRPRYPKRAQLTMSSSAIPRFLLPRGQLYLRSLQTSRQFAVGLRHASTSTAKPQKARVLEQPDRFRAPSHPARLRKKPKAYPGPALSEYEVQAQKTKKYPHMMAPDGSFMHWFLTNRAIHTWITLVRALLAQTDRQSVRQKESYTNPLSRQF